MHSVAWLKFYFSTFLKSSFILRTLHPVHMSVVRLDNGLLLTWECRPLVLLSSVNTRLTNILPRLAIICLQAWGMLPLLSSEKVCRINQRGPPLPSGLQWSICQHWGDWWNNEICIFTTPAEIHRIWHSSEWGRGFAGFLLRHNPSESFKVES